MTLLLGNSKHSGEQSGTPSGLSVGLKPEHMVSMVTFSVYSDDNRGRAAVDIVIFLHEVSLQVFCPHVTT